MSDELSAAADIGCDIDGYPVRTPAKSCATLAAEAQMALIGVRGGLLGVPVSPAGLACELGAGAIPGRKFPVVRVQIDPSSIVDANPIPPLSAADMALAPVSPANICFDVDGNSVHAMIGQEYPCGLPARIGNASAANLAFIAGEPDRTVEWSEPQDPGSWGMFWLGPNGLVDLARLPADDTPARDRAGPKDPVHDRVHDVIGDILDGKVARPAREAVRRALDKADTPLTGRAAADRGLGRAIRLGS